MSSIVKICKLCAKALPESGDFAQCSNCKENYHFSPCSTVAASTWKAMSKKDKAEWRCQKCRAERNRANSLSSVIDKATAQKQQRNDDDVIEQSESKRPRNNESLLIGSIKNDVEMLQSKFNVFVTNLAEIKLMLTDLSTNVVGLSNTTKELENVVKTLHDEIKNLKEENWQKAKQIEFMAERMDDMQQQLLANNVEILNVPVLESPKKAVIHVAEVVGMQLKEEDVEDAFLLKKKNKIIIKFGSKRVKAEFMKKVKTTKPTADNLKTDEPKKRIFVNDELTAFNRFLLWKTKNKAKELSWRFVWVKDGKIMAKKDESARIIYIRNEPDIEKLN